jgi:RNA polymerase sigma-70 factor (ECF subfamily)
MVRDRAAAEDLTQEVFSDALRALSTFRGDASPRTWLLSIARNRCIDYLRAKKRDPWGGALDETSHDPDAHADQAALGSEWFADRSVVLRALDALAEGDRALIVLRFKNGLEYDELATAFGLREGTVRMRVSRALARMRHVLESDAQPPSGAATREPLAPTRGAPAPVLSRAPAPSGALPPPPPPQAASSSRSAQPPSAPSAGDTLRGRAFGAPPAGQPISWWARLKAAAGLGHGAEPTAPTPPHAHPVGALGLALTACEPATVSDGLAARLGALVEALPT